MTVIAIIEFFVIILLINVVRYNHRKFKAAYRKGDILCRGDERDTAWDIIRACKEDR